MYGGELTVFKKALARLTIQLGMSECFDPDTTCKLINILSATYVPRDVLSDLVMLFRAPGVGRFQDIGQAVERANMTTKTNVTIINEATTINSHRMKSVPNNDGESVQVFYTQNYDMQNF